MFKNPQELQKFQMKQHGFTLIELIVTVVVIGILATIAVPSFSSYFERQRLVGAADSLHGAIRFARSESLKRNKAISVTVNDLVSSEWCIGIKDSAGSCDCAATDCTVDGVIRVISYTEFPGVTANTTGSLYEFDPKRGILSSVNDIVFTNSSGTELTLKLTKLGNPSLCTPVGSDVSGYSKC